MVGMALHSLGNEGWEQGFGGHYISRALIGVLTWVAFAFSGLCF